MSALVCLYIVGITALVAAAAAATEWAVQGRVPTRHLWSAAMICALLVPPLAIVQHARGAPHTAASPAQSVIVEVAQLGHAAGAAMGSRERGSPLHTLRNEYHAVLDRASHLSARRILALWIVTSLVLIAWIVYGAMHWHRERRAWEVTELDGVRVHLSEETGPAVLGLVSQRIVVPAWVRSLAPEYRELMLAHECEHIAARDPQRLAFALGALVLMPWNPALWWCAARMRRAIEMDCDARVLRRHPAPRAYGYLLLQVAARGNNAGPLAVPLVNLLRLPSELELRLRAMTRPRTLAGRTALAGAAIAGAAMMAAFTAPVPRVTRAAVRSLRHVVRLRVPQRAGQVDSAVVHVGSSVLRLDSVTITPGTLRGVLRSIRIAAPALRDPLPSAHTADSLAMLTRALRDRARQLDSVQAHADSLDAEVRAMRARAAMLDSAPVHQHMWADLGTRNPDARTTRTLRRMNAALGRYYPGVSPGSSLTPGGVWFLADSSGAVIQTRRVSQEPGVGFAAPNVDRKNVDFVVVEKTPPGSPPFSMVWMQLKR